MELPEKRQRRNPECNEDPADSTDTEDTGFNSASVDAFSGSSSPDYDHALISDEEKPSPEKESEHYPRLQGSGLNARETSTGSSDQDQPKNPWPLIDFGSTTFRPLIEKSDAYVDKTMSVRVALEGPPFKLALAPRRSMKSVTMNTVKICLQIVVDKSGNPNHNVIEKDGVFIEKPESELTENYKLFKNNNLKIFQCHCDPKHTKDFSHCENRQFFYKHCGEHPVMYADWKCIGGTNMLSIIYGFRACLQISYQEHAYLLKCDGLWRGNEDVPEENKFSKQDFCNYYDDNEVASELMQRSCIIWVEFWKCRIVKGFVQLTAILRTWFKKKIFVLIDEYDHPILKAMISDDVEDSFLETLLNFVQELMSAIIKNNDDNVDHVLLNACMQLAQVLSGEGNNIEPYPFLLDHRLSEFYGFTENDIAYLLEKDAFQKYKKRLPEIKEWYNKYQVVGKPETAIYSSWSFLHFLEYGVIKSYWCKSGYVHGLKKGFGNKGIQERMEQLFRDESVWIRPLEKFRIDDLLKLRKLLKTTQPILSYEEQCLFLQYIGDHGYLNTVNEHHFQGSLGETIHECEVKIPNQEIKMELGREFFTSSLFMEKYHITNNAVENYKRTVKLLDDSNEATITDFANSVCELFSNHKEPARHEFEFHSPLYTFLKQDPKFTVYGEPPAVTGSRRRVDIVTFRAVDNVVIILEIKRLGTAEKGLNQLVSKEYYRVLEMIKSKVKVKKCILAAVHIESRHPHHVSVCYIPSFEVERETPEEAQLRNRVVESAS